MNLKNITSAVKAARDKLTLRLKVEDAATAFMLIDNLNDKAQGVHVCPECKNYGCAHSVHIFNGIEKLADAVNALVCTDDETYPGIWTVHYFTYDGVAFFQLYEYRKGADE